MRLPRKGILIRFAIYGSLIGYFGWQAYQRSQEDAASSAPDAAEGVKSKSMQLPDGRSLEVLEVTPEQAEAMFGVRAAVERGDPTPAEAAPSEDGAAAAISPPGGDPAAPPASPPPAGEAAN